LAITLAGLGVALGLPWLALLAEPPAHLWVGGAAIAFCILDCLDGDVARTGGRVTELGAYADFLVDLVYRVAFYAAIGMLYDRQGDPGPGALSGAAIGIGAAALALIARACRLYAARGARGRGASQNAAGAALYAFLSGLDHLLPVLLIAAGAAGRLDWLLAWIAAYSAGDLVVTQLSILRRLR
ncbi:MAG: CDP-alcohol phosphatidyltransferase family protein, partial [Pseudomonadota bacterium]